MPNKAQFQKFFVLFSIVYSQLLSSINNFHNFNNQFRNVSINFEFPYPKNVCLLLSFAVPKNLPNVSLFFFVCIFFSRLVIIKITDYCVSFLPKYIRIVNRGVWTKRSLIFFFVNSQSYHRDYFSKDVRKFSSVCSCLWTLKQSFLLSSMTLIVFLFFFEYI